MLHTAMLLGTLTGILLAIGFFFAGPDGMLIALILAVIINFVSYWFSDRIVLGLYRAKPTDKKELVATAGKLAKEAGIPKPKLYLIPIKTPNAFATGRGPRHSAIAVTEGLLELNGEEIEGVIAHEMGHIKNRDILVSTMAATIAGAISYLAQMGYYSLFFSGGGRKGQGNIIGLVLIVIFAPLAALFIRLAISRAREYKADYTGALLSKNPLGLASALRKISEYARHSPIKGNTATAHMWIENPFKADGFTALFSTHPPIESRIQRLEALKLVR